MDETAYKVWWQLHLRVSLGEVLAPQEQEAYESGQRELQADEHYNTDSGRMRQIRQELPALQAKYEQNKIRYEAMTAEITELEARLSEPERQLLGIGN